MNAGRAYRILSAGPALLLVMCLVCCSAPDTWEMFVKNTGDGDRSEYIFPLKMSDSLAIYDIELFTRLDISDAAFAALPEVIPLNITYTSPSGTGYYEEAGISKNGWSRASHFSYEYRLPFRQGLIPVEYGDWSMSIDIPEEAGIEGLRGFGIRVTRKNRTR